MLSLIVSSSYFLFSLVLTNSTLALWAARVLSVTSFWIYASPPATSVTETSAGSPSSSSSSSGSPGKTFFLTIVGCTGTGLGFGLAPSLVSSFASSFGFGAGTGGAIGFPVDVFPFLPVVTVIELGEMAVSLDSLASSSYFFSTFSTSSLPPGSVTIVALASFSAVSTAFLFSSTLAVNFLILAAVFSTVSASFASTSLQVF